MPRPGLMPPRDPEPDSAPSIRGRIIAVIVALSCFQVGASALVTGELYIPSGQTSSGHVNLEGVSAYVAGLVFLAVAALAGRSLFRR